MSQKKSVPVIAGWFTPGDAPQLLGSQCRSCGSYFFPKESLYCRNPGCQGREFDEVPLSRSGRIWSYTEHYYEPPEPYVSPKPFVPYTIAAVELEKEKMVVLGQVAAGVPHASLAAGQRVELVVEKLYEDAETEYTVWKWKPVAAS